MTRRIAFAILTIVWLSLLTAGVSTYLITRTLMLDDLDQTIVGRLASLPEVERPASLQSFAPDSRDRFVVKSPQGRIIARPSTTPSNVPAPIVLNAAFTYLGDGSRQRTLTVLAYARRTSPDEPLSQVTVVYSAPADHLDKLLTRLLISLAGLGVFSAVATAAVAKAVATATLRPMREAADIIGKIDEKSLDRRIEVERLPTEMRAVGQRLNDLLARLETAFAQRKRFLADASHELRTPVAALVTTLEVGLRRQRDGSGYLRILESCLTDARLLNELVVSLLEQVRSERFAAQLELSPVPISTVLRHSADIAERLGSGKKITIHREIPEQLVLFTDEQKIRSIMTNLLSNAVEYNKEGGQVWIRARLVAADAALPLVEALRTTVPEGLGTTGRVLVLEVADDGPGIGAEHLTNLFEPFYRADAARESAGHHLGLGLATVQAHVAALGGECRVKSPAVDIRGCEFTVRLPVLEIVSDSRAMESAVDIPSPVESRVTKEGVV